MNQMILRPQKFFKRGEKWERNCRHWSLVDNGFKYSVWFIVHYFHAIFLDCTWLFWIEFKNSSDGFSHRRVRDQNYSEFFFHWQALPVTKTKNIDSQCINCKDKYLISGKIEVHCYKKRRRQWSMGEVSPSAVLWIRDDTREKHRTGNAELDLGVHGTHPNY